MGQFFFGRVTMSVCIEIDDQDQADFIMVAIKRAIQEQDHVALYNIMCEWPVDFRVVDCDRARALGRLEDYVQ